MYPTLYDAVLDLIGLSIPALKLVQSFGFFVAMAFLAAMYILTKEIKRKESLGLLTGITEKISIGKPLEWTEYFINFLIGFVVGFKLIAIALNFEEATNNTQEFLLSSQGNLWGGLILGVLSLYLVYKDDPRFKGIKSSEIEKVIMPHERVGAITMIAVIAGIFGAKIFHNLENFDQFLEDPIDALLSFSGLTFYGGLIVAAASIAWYAKSKKIGVLHLCDSVSPGLILAYGIGRIGCQVAGDGDWGIPNDLPMPEWLSFLPEWVWAYDYPNNVHNINLKADFEAMGLVSETGKAFPTPIYETTMSIFIFAILWIIRTKITTPGILFGIYLIFNGIERFLIEQIRVNVKLKFIGIEFTQAQLISSLLIILGILMIVYLKRSSNQDKSV